MEPEIIVGLDIGTTKVCAVVASIDENGKFNVLGVGRSPSDGLTRGVVTNIDKTVRSIQSAVSEAEGRSGIKIQSVIVGIAGDHIQSFQSRGVIAISGLENEISQSDVNRLIEDTKRVALPSDRRIIHVIPQEFIIDGQDGVSDPVGMSGVRLEANVHIITGLVTAAQNIYKCVQRAGLQISDMVLEPLASSYAVLDEEKKEVGIALLDVGGGTTDLAVFEDRTIRYTAVVPIAGNQVTNDIRKGLGVLTEQAEKLKCQHGFAYLPSVVDEEPIVIPGIGGRPPLEFDKKLLAQIILPRMEEIFEIAAIAREVLGLPVKIGIPGGFSAGLVREIENPIYATCVGLVLHGLRHKDKTVLNFNNGKSSGSIKRIFVKMKSWFDEL
ncbi:MAG: cell division protein FtsA [Ignavibacteriales bacterium]|nr:cell division protein FtsA [Ignavibacteriales bacterium]